MTQKIVVACGTGVATSTLVHQRLDDFLAKNSIVADVCQCTFTEIEGNIDENTVVIIASSKVGDEVGGVPVLVSIPYISGVGIEAFEKKILAYLK